MYFVPKKFKSMTALQHRLAFSVLLFAAALPTLPADLPIPNFHQVNDHVFRGGQPADQAWPGLAKMGVKLVIDLRREDEHSSAAEAQAVQSAGMKYVNVPMKGVVAPDNNVVSRLLSLLNSQDAVFIHCKRGADRTGAIVACYRIEHDHWDRKRALEEAKSFGMSWDQFGLKRYVKAFQPMPERVAEDFSVVKKSQ
jgi:tyrosine-protein phosphatase SIW14